MSSSHDGQVAESLVEKARRMDGRVKSLEMKLKPLRAALTGVSLSEDETAALAEGTVPALTPEVQKFLALRGDYSDALAELDDIRETQYLIISHALGHTYPHYWTASDVREWCCRGEHHPRLTAKVVEAVEHLELVPTEPFRRRALTLLDEGVSKTRIAVPIHKALSAAEAGNGASLGASSFRCPDDWNAAADILGLVPSRRGTKPYRIFTQYEQATVLARVLGMEPHTAGV